MGYRSFANGIILFAIEDWRALCEGKKRSGVTFDSLRNFFKGEWCSILCGQTNPLYILRKLEDEREQLLNRRIEA